MSALSSPGILLNRWGVVVAPVARQGLMIDIPTDIDLSSERLLERRSALGLGDDDRQRLQTRLEDVRAHWPGFLDALYVRLQAQTSTAAVLFKRPDTVQRLMRAQTRYLTALFSSPFDAEHARFLVHLGLIHYRLGVTPQWYIATYAHFICEHLPVLAEGDRGSSGHLADTVALIRSVFYDISLVLDAYGVGEATHQRAQRLDAVSVGRPDGAPQGEAAAHRAARRTMPQTLANVRVTDDEVSERIRFLDITEEDLGALRALRPAITRHTPAILEEFYEFITTHPETAALVPEQTIDRLKRQVASYWAEVVSSDFSRPYAASRMRIGLMHERIGLSLQWYFGGVARQLIAFLQTDEMRADAVSQRALIKAVFFDLTHVVDAYMEARADALLRSDGHASALIASLNAAVAIVDRHQRVMSANRAMVELFPGDAGMLYRMTIDHALPIPEVRTVLDRVRKEGLTRAVAFGKLGARHLKISAFRLAGRPDAPQDELAVMLDDVTELIRATQDGGTDRDRLLEVVDSSSVALWEMDRSDMTIFAASGSVLALTGYRDVHFVGRPRAWIDCVVPSDQPRIRRFLQQLKDLQRQSIDYRIRRADGNEHWIRSHVTLLSDPEAQPTLRAISISIEEERRQQDARLQSLGMMAGGIAHLLNNSLMAVGGSLEVLARGSRDTGQQALISPALQEVQQAKLLTGQMLAFAGRQPLRPVPLELTAAIPRIVSALAGSTPAIIEVDVAASDRGWPVMADPGKLETVLRGLIANACEASPTDGQILVQARNVSGDDLDTTDVGVGTDWAELSVTDSGAGMSAEVRRRAIEPFFTTKSADHGHHGLGLSVAHGFAVQSGGYLLIESEEGRGTTVRLRLPRIADTQPHPARDARSSRTVMVVEDHKLVRRVVVELVGSFGFAVVAAASAAEAMEMAEQQSIDILLTDIRLGRGMNGVELAHWFTQRIPSVGIVLMSGYTVEHLNLGELPSRYRFLAKPFEPAQLRRELEASLPQASTSA